MGFLGWGAMILRMKAGHRETWPAAILFLEAVVSIGFVPRAIVHGDLGSAGAQEKAKGSKIKYARAAARGSLDYAAAAEAFQKAIAGAPNSAELWMKWADFALERFRILDLELRSLQSGMAVVLRLEAQGLHSGPETREDLLRQSATADPEQQGIWGELGVEQVWYGKREDAAATLKTARERQANDLWTLRLDAMMSAAQGDWKEAQSKLLVVGSRSPAVFRGALQSWPRNLLPPQNVSSEIWNCARNNSAACVDKIKFSAGEVTNDSEQLFAEERWEKLAALPEPRAEVPAAWFRRGVALAELRECARAIPALERGLDVGAETAAFWLELCYASEAERAVVRLGALGNQAVFHRVRGDFLVRVKGHPQAATGEYAKARRLQPRDPMLAERIAQAYENIGDMQRAKQAAHEALALDPRRLVSVRLLAAIAMNERDYSSALENLDQLLQKNPNDAWAHVQIGIAYAQTGRAQEALQNMQPAMAAGYPDERGALHAILARVLRQLGREQEAQSAAAESARLSNLFQLHGQAARPEEPQ
jgi:tetratricopeptide (TPR) repeat protein